MDIISYKPNAVETIQRLRLLYERKAADRIFASFRVPSKTLAQFRKKHPEGYCEYPDPDVRIRFWNELLQERSTVFDDSVPAAYLSEFDQGLYGALLGGDIRFMVDPETGWISSMVPPLLQDWSQFESLTFSKTHPWFSRYVQQTEIFVRGAQDKFGISHFILIDGLNLIFELIGATQTYVSLFDHPEMICRAIDFAFDLNLTIHNTFFDIVPTFMGGTCSTMGQWFPGRIILESIDPFHMTSVDVFEKWGYEPVERIFKQFDGGALHIHGNGRHLLEAACPIKGLKAIYMGDDTGFPNSCEILDELRSRAGNVPLIVRIKSDDFAEKLKRHKLPGGMLYEVTDVISIDAVNRYMEEVRAYRI